MILKLVFYAVLFSAALNIFVRETVKKHFTALIIYKPKIIVIAYWIITFLLIIQFLTLLTMEYILIFTNL